MTTPEPPSDAAARLDGVRVLIADDAADVRLAVAATLESAGAAVITVSSAEAALVALRSERPDVLVSDLSMPGKGGYWLIGEVRALAPEHGGTTPAAALTALTGPQHRASALGAGFQYHLEKPLGIRDLVGIVAILAVKDGM
jgi:CheY-like chemotaxis protein